MFIDEKLLEKLLDLYVCGEKVSLHGFSASEQLFPEFERCVETNLRTSFPMVQMLKFHDITV